MNKKRIEAKIYDIKSQMALIEAQVEGEIQGAAGMPAELAHQLEFQQMRVDTLDTFLDMEDSGLNSQTLAYLSAWLRQPDPLVRAKLALAVYALGFTGLEDWMMAQEEPSA